MKKRNVMLCFTCWIFAAGVFISCGKKEDTATLSELADGKGSELENEVYLTENGAYEPYIVISNDYRGNVLLLRKYALDEPMRINEYYSYYEDSEIDVFLNGEFMERLGEISDMIESVDIPISANSSIGESGGEVTYINRKVFLLSSSEICIETVEKEGMPIDFFQNAQNRIAFKKDGDCVSWWLRTPDTWWISCTYTVGSNNKIGSTNSGDKNYIRPALCMKPGIRVKKSDEIMENGKACYVLQLNK